MSLPASLRNEEIIRARIDGQTCARIAETHGISRQRVNKVLRDHGHGTNPLPLLDRIMASFEAEDHGFDTACWVWQGHLKQGYGVLRVANRHKLAHRVSYECVKGAIPAGLVLDHLCRNRACVNPQHLEPVSNGENVRRGRAAETLAARMRAKTHCAKGHPYSGDNLRLTHKGHRICKECQRVDCRRRGAAKREIRAAGNGGGQGCGARETGSAGV